MGDFIQRDVFSRVALDVCSSAGEGLAPLKQIATHPVIFLLA